MTISTENANPPAAKSDAAKKATLRRHTQLGFLTEDSTFDSISALKFLKHYQARASYDEVSGFFTISDLSDSAERALVMKALEAFGMQACSEDGRKVVADPLNCRISIAVLLPTQVTHPRFTRNMAGQDSRSV